SLQKMYEYAWKAFYADCCKEIKMAKLYLEVIEKEKKDGTYNNIDLSSNRSWPVPGKKDREL
ncbi:MAG: hypothetical protein KAI50_05710, partial [Desulfobacterales bacterium]|nr:hypothetical protein [Desulfobacterales bacterium]